MKRETLRHPKTFDLASRLGIDRARALGILTLLWDFTADSAIQGDVGKWPNGSIARACDWLEDADAFVEALTEAKWIDRSSDHRLIIHDWPDHCERWVRAKIAKLKMAFLPEYGTDEPTVVATIEKPVDATPPRDRTEPNQTKPNRTERPTGDSVGRTDGREFADGPKDPIILGPGHWRESLPTRERIARVVSGDPGVNPSRLRAADLELCIRAAAVHHYGDMPADWLEGVLRSMQARRTPLENRWAFFRTALINAAERADKNYHALEARVVIPSRHLATTAAASPTPVAG